MLCPKMSMLNNASVKKIMSGLWLFSNVSLPVGKKLENKLHSILSSIIVIASMGLSIIRTVLKEELAIEAVKSFQKHKGTLDQPQILVNVLRALLGVIRISYAKFYVWGPMIWVWTLKIAKDANARQMPQFSSHK